MKRSARVRLLLMGSATLALSACDDTQDLTQGSVYDTVEQCRSAGAYDAAYCEESFAAAARAHADAAPRYDSLAACEEEFGPGRCEAGTASGQSAGTGSFFVPLMAGFLMGRLLDGGRVYPQPLYRPHCPPGARSNACPSSATGGATGAYGRFYTGGGRAVAAAPGSVAVDRALLSGPAPRTTTTLARGGFGARAQAVGVSSGGRSSVGG